MTKIEWIDDSFYAPLLKSTQELTFKAEDGEKPHVFKLYGWEDSKPSPKNYMGGKSVNFTDSENDARSDTILRIFGNFHKKYPKLLPNLRSILEPGAGSGSMTLHLYRYFREEIFVNGFPRDFKHSGLELLQINDDWYQQQEAFEGLGFPSYPRGQFTTHYSLQKGVDFIDYLENPANQNSHDAIFGISIFDLLLDFSGSTNLLSKTRKLLKKDGIFFLAFTDIASFDETPHEAGFVKLWPEDSRDLFTFWQAV